MKYGDERCNTIVDGADVLVSIFHLYEEPRGMGRSFMLSDVLQRFKRYDPDRRPHVKLTWFRFVGNEWSGIVLPPSGESAP